MITINSILIATILSLCGVGGSGGGTGKPENKDACSSGGFAGGKSNVFSDSADGSGGIHISIKSIGGIYGGSSS